MCVSAIAARAESVGSDSWNLRRACAQHGLANQVGQRLEQLGTRRAPITGGLPCEADTVPAEDAFQAEQRQVIAVLADQDLSEQPRTGLAAGDRLRRLGSHDHVLLQRIGVVRDQQPFAAKAAFAAASVAASA